MRRTSVIAVIGSLALAIGADCACAQEAQVHFEIPAGDAMETLQAFHRQSGVSLLYLPEMLREVKTDAVAGEWTVRKHWRECSEVRLFRSSMELTRKVSRRPSIKRLPADPGPSAVAGAPTTGEATERRSLPGDAEGEIIEEVVVTGTLIHGVLDLTSPLQFITKESMKKTPYATVQDALKALPAAFGGGISEDTVGSGNFTLGTAVNLRGLGAGATLVLVNGERQPYSGANADFVDLSLLPTTAIERIEVLPDGASAIYGSDAIAGVVNVIMRRSVERPETHLRYGVARGVQPSGSLRSCLARAGTSATPCSRISMRSALRCRRRRAATRRTLTKDPSGAMTFAAPPAVQATYSILQHSSRRTVFQLMPTGP